MKKLRIGVSACFFHADPKRAVFKGKTLVYLEHSLAEWLMREGAVPWMITPVTPPSGGKVTLGDYASELDGLVLEGGSDVCPASYGEEPLKPEWNGDLTRDRYETALFEEFRSRGKPVLGVCRGAQLINVACGGTLYQDIATQVPGALNHRDWEIYDQNFHSIQFEKGSKLSKHYPGVTSAKVNTVHHQAIKELGKGLAIEARAVPDGIIEAVRGTGPSYVYAVQWHPEFQRADDREHLDGGPILREFLGEARKFRGD